MGKPLDKCALPDCGKYREVHLPDLVGHTDHPFVEPIPVPTFDQLVDAVGDLPSGQLATSGLIPAPQEGATADPGLAAILAEVPSARPRCLLHLPSDDGGWNDSTRAAYERDQGEPPPCTCRVVAIVDEWVHNYSGGINPVACIAEAASEAYRAGFEAARLAGHCSHRPAPTEPCHACRLTARAQSKEE